MKHKKIDELRLILATSHLEVISILETRLRESIPDTLINIPNYTIVRQDRVLQSTRKKRGGGLIIYVKNQIADRLVHLNRSDKCSEFIEAQWVKIVNPN